MDEIRETAMARDGGWTFESTMAEPRFRSRRLQTGRYHLDWRIDTPRGA